MTMGELQITVDDLSGPEIAAFLEEHIEEMRSTTPPESKHALDLDGLRRPEITFWTVHADGEIVGSGALKALDAGHAELKSMRVPPTHRRRGIASTLLEHILSEANRRGFRRVSLETGSFEFFQPARQLYLAHGFEYCEPFADYKADPNSVFMTRSL
jgi:putative acetyltransferase